MYLGLDLGTSSLKAMMIDDQQKIVAVATADLDVTRPHDGWSEQAPEDWIEACEAVMAALTSSYARGHSD